MARVEYNSSTINGRISKSGFTYNLGFGILIANTEFVDEVPKSINCVKAIHGKKNVCEKVNSWAGSFEPSAPICGRAYACKLATVLLPARYEARVAGQGNLLGDRDATGLETFGVA